MSYRNGEDRNHRSLENHAKNPPALGRLWSILCHSTCLCMQSPACHLMNAYSNSGNRINGFSWICTSLSLDWTCFSLQENGEDSCFSCIWCYVIYNPCYLRSCNHKARANLGHLVWPCLKKKSFFFFLKKKRGLGIYPIVTYVIP